VRPKGGQVHRDTRLVVGRATGEQPVSDLGGGERIGVPQLERAGGLHVVVGIEQYCRGARRRGAMPDHRRHPALHPQDLHVAQACAAQQRRGEFRAALYVPGSCRVGGHRGDGDQLIEVSAYGGQDGADGGGQLDGHRREVTGHDPAPSGVGSQLAGQSAIMTLLARHWRLPR